MDGQPRGLPQVAHQPENLANLEGWLGTLAFTKIGNRTYYRPDDVERAVGNVEDKTDGKARWKGKTI